MSVVSVQLQELHGTRCTVRLRLMLYCGTVRRYDVRALRQLTSQLTVAPQQSADCHLSRKVKDKQMSKQYINKENKEKIMRT